MQIIEFPIFPINSIDQTLVLLDILCSAFLNGLKKLLILRFDRLLLHLVLLDELLHLTRLDLEVVEFLDIFVVVFLHLLLGVISNLLGLEK
jgi:hypothetical protein